MTGRESLSESRLLYVAKTWRCRIFGHAWGPEQSDYDPNVGDKLESWHNCERCDAWWETFHYSVGKTDRVIG